MIREQLEDMLSNLIDKNGRERFAHVEGQPSLLFKNSFGMLSVFGEELSVIVRFSRCISYPSTAT